MAGFYHDHGVDVHNRTVWAVAGLDTDRVRLEGEEPLRASVTYEIDAETLTLTVSEDLEVLDVETATRD